MDAIVVNAALWGATAIGVTEGSTKQFQDVVNMDIMAGYLAAHPLAPNRVREWWDAAKAVIAIGGTAAWVTSGPVAHTAHCMSKLAQARMMELIANDFAEEKLMVLTVHPGCVWTDTSKIAPECFYPCTSSPCRILTAQVIPADDSFSPHDKFDRRSRPMVGASSSGSPGLWRTNIG